MQISPGMKEKYTFMVFSMLIFVSLPVQLFTSVIIHPSVLYLPALILSLILFIRLTKNPTVLNAVYLGIAIGFSMLADLKGFVFLPSIFVYSAYLAYKKKYLRVKLFFISLGVSVLIGAYPFVRNYIKFGSPFGFWKSDSSLGAFLPHTFSKFFSYFGAFWGGIYGGMQSIRILISLGVIALTIATVYGLYKYKFGKKFNLEILSLIALMTLLLGFEMTCNIDVIITSLKCVGDVVQGRYLIIFDLIIALFAGLALIKFKNLISLAIVIISSALFAIDFLWVFL